MTDVTLTRFEAAFEALKPTLRLAVIYGGDSRQPGAVLQPTLNTRPWKSYEAVATTIAAVLAGLGFAHVRVMSDDLHLPERLRAEGIDMAWLNTGGVQGRDPMAHAPALLELAGIPYVGHDPLNVSRLDNKHVFKRELTYLDIDTAPFISWSLDDGPFDPSSERVVAAFGDAAGPFVVKPVTGRASLGVSVAESPAELAAQVDALLARTRHAALIERYLPGREFCVAVCGGLVSRGGRFERLAEPFTFSAVERVLGPDERIFTSMDHQAITPRRARLLGDDPLRAPIEALARRVYRGFDLQSVVRLDLRQDADGRLCVLEANPKPDLRRPDAQVTSLATMGLAEAGMDYADLIRGLLAERLWRWRAHEADLYPRLAARVDAEAIAP